VGFLVIEGTEGHVHSAEEGDDFIEQFHDDFLNRDSF
jgi:hypothetical protein